MIKNVVETYIWEEADIVCGLYVIRQPKDGSRIKFTESYARTVTYKIGFDNHILADEENRDGHYGFCSCLTDGWYCRIGSKKDLTKKLTEENFRPLTRGEYQTMVSNTSQGFKQ